MLSYLFGSASDDAADPLVEEGHRGLDVIIDGEVLCVDVDILAEASGLFLQVQSTNERECPLEDFPGGIVTFRQIVHLLTSMEEEAKLHVNEDNILNLFEAAWLLECPRVFDEVMRSAYLRSLSSRRRVELLEHLLPFTAVSNPSEGPIDQERLLSDLGNSTTGTVSATEDFMRIFLLETGMWQRTERAALDLAENLDQGDFVLGPRFATGSLRICCEFLRLHRKRQKDAGLMSNAFQPMSSMWKNLTDRPLRAKVLWDDHLFALQCIRKRLPLEVREEQSMPGEQEEDDEAKADIPEDLCFTVDDCSLLCLAELATYVDIAQAPPNWAALIIRMLVLSGRKEQARKAFIQAFPNSPRLRLLAWQPPRILPAEWLADVATHVEASDVLLRILSGFREMDAEEFCDIIEHVLLAHFLATPHCAPIVLTSELINEIVGACFDAGVKVRAPLPPLQIQEVFEADNVKNDLAEGRAAGDCNGSAPRRCPARWEGQHLLWRAAHLGTRLFEAAFVAQEGFLPHRWPDAFAGPEGPSEASQEEPGEPQELPLSVEPVVVEVAGSCLWDEGLLQIKLLRPIMEAGCAAPHEATLHFGQQVIMRHLWYHFHGSYYEVSRLQELWELARWPLCEDPRLVREALEYLKGTYRALRSPNGAWQPEHEEALFRMFTGLDLQRLPGQALLTPWVPAQSLTVRLMVQQQPAEQFHAELQQEVLTATESLKSINSQCQKLHNKLNIVEQRTVINKSQINDAILVIEEHQRKKSQAHPSKRMSSLA